MVGYRSVRKEAYSTFESLIKASVMSVLITRSACDPIFGLTQNGGVGIGGVLNILILIIGLNVIVGSVNNRNVRQALIWLPFLLVAAIGTLRSPDFVAAMRTFIELSTYFAMYALGLFYSRTKEEFLASLRFVLMSFLIPFAVAPVQYFQSAAVIEGERRLQSTFTHPNILAFYLLIIIILMILVNFVLPQNERPLSRLLGSLYIVAAPIMLIGTQTRSAWIALACVLFIFFSYRSVLGLIVIVCFSFLSILIPSIRERLSSLQMGNDYAGWETKLNSYAWRKLLWHYSLEDLSGDYVLGRGLEAFRTFSTRFFTLASENTDAHNVFVQMTYDLGLLGTTLLVLIFCSVGIGAILAPSGQTSAKLIVMSLIVFYVICAYSDNLLFYLTFNWYYWFSLGLCLGALKHGFLKEYRRL